MRGTVFSVTSHSNGGTTGSQGSVNNSIIMMQS